MRRRTVVMFIAPVAAASLIATGCGGSSKKSEPGATTSAASNSDVAAILSGIKTNDQTKPQNIAMEMAITPDGAINNPQAAAIIGSGPITIKFSGPIDPTAKSADMTFDLRAGKIVLPGKLRLVDGKTGFVGLNDKWYTISPKTLSSTTAKTATDPNKAIQSLGNPADLLSNAKVVGAEDIGGITSDHITGDINIEGLAKAMQQASTSTGKTADPAATAKAVEQIKKALKSGTVDVWVGQKDKLVHKMLLDAALVFPADVSSQTMGLKGAGIKLSVQSVPVDSVKVETPAGALPSAQLQNDLMAVVLANLGTGSPTP